MLRSSGAAFPRGNVATLSQLPLRNGYSCEGGQPLRKPIHLSTTGSASDRSPPRLKIQSARWLKIQSARTNPGSSEVRQYGSPLQRHMQPAPGDIRVHERHLVEPLMRHDGAASCALAHGHDGTPGESKTQLAAKRTPPTVACYSTKDRFRLRRLYFFAPTI
jgi:hypothetical protein